MEINEWWVNQVYDEWAYLIPHDEPGTTALNFKDYLIEQLRNRTPYT